jgi:hypothetical protein
VSFGHNDRVVQLASELETDFLRQVPSPPLVPTQRPPSAPAPGGGVRGLGGLSVLLWMLDLVSGLTDEDRQPALVFKSHEFNRESPDGKWRFEALQALTPEEIKAICGDEVDVQKLMDDAVDTVKSRGEKLAPGPFGTAVHKEVEDAIDKIGPENTEAELSIAKDDEGTYRPKDTNKNEKDSIRVDIRQINGEETICIHDIKTGRGLDKKRIQDIFEKVAEAYPNAKRILITEARPDNIPLPRPRIRPRNR